MFVLVDRDALVFRHAHEDRTVVSALATLEVAHCAVTIVEAGAGCLAHLTDLELKKLYENTTGQKWTSFCRPALVQAVDAVALALEQSDVNGFEAKQQAAKISLDDQGFYRYVKGAYTPARLMALFLPPARTATAGAVPSTPAAGSAAQATTPAATVAPPAPIAAPRGGNKALIWSVADALWEQAGRIANTKAVLDLRRKAMDQLEQQGVKRTSSSSELGNWQKARLNGA